MLEAVSVNDYSKQHLDKTAYDALSPKTVSVNDYSKQHLDILMCA